ncbi:hypothetical protein DFA_11286 [Cavenderia fasciculata]|uniref:Uncharacterized protein n=1 Tax=Cavenderia fasciculata TaxID=261658 RepID=F4QC38_CACFS|nr:uncharacterized protein DFA_11286 [Cavenderia fasciculata]EGG13525.1 hypothetical protein DFA_11286 [Cavenderia fasciculata]|eukprot:XP_004350229.1 hypothetical protein DFA_11286 [Cavenderia fasciculata]
MERLLLAKNLSLLLAYDTALFFNPAQCAKLMNHPAFKMYMDRCTIDSLNANNCDGFWTFLKKDDYNQMTNVRIVHRHSHNMMDREWDRATYINCTKLEIHLMDQSNPPMLLKAHFMLDFVMPFIYRHRSVKHLTIGFPRLREYFKNLDDDYNSDPTNEKVEEFFDALEEMEQLESLTIFDFSFNFVMKYNHEIDSEPTIEHTNHLIEDDSEIEFDYLLQDYFIDYVKSKISTNPDRSFVLRIYEEEDY